MSSNANPERSEYRSEAPQPSRNRRTSATSLLHGTAKADDCPEPAAFPGPCPEGTDFPASARSTIFRKTAFPGASQADWNNWHWQLQQTLRTVEAIDRLFPLKPEERAAMVEGGGLPTAITPYYASLIDAGNPADPLRRSMIPTLAELRAAPEEKVDPLAEDSQSPLPGLVHRYPDRVLFLATEYCSAYCRYCTRSRLVGQVQRQRYCCAHWQKALAYIRETPTIRDVVVSGGDPLTMPDEPLEWLLTSLRAIRHVEVIRIGTKTPAVLPMRVTANLVKILRRCHPLWMSVHFTHPDELTPEAAEACARLADAGCPLGSQTVLLRDINDDVAVMRRLMTGLMKIRVRPYYLY
ncbi:MAG: KamA family radical SAM protein, partial [Planctomycetes bacterium]|nr:KamA family radical SAM protein [Planctomycetota bacterium]